MTNNIFVYSWTTDDGEYSTSIRCYGIDEDGCSVVLKINDFNPYIYIEIPRNEEDVEELQRQLFNLTTATKIVEKDHLYSRFDRQKFLFVQMCSRSKLGLIYSIVKKNPKFKIHEEHATPVLQLTSLRSIPMSTWIAFEGKRVKKKTSCDKEYIVKCNDLHKSTCTKQVDPKIMAFDLEVNSDFMTSMPSNRPEDVIFQASCVFQHGGIKRKILITLDGIDLDEQIDKMLNGIKVIACKSEEELLKEFINILSKERPNVLTGYNILGFDIQYMIKRCERYGLLEEFKLAGFNKSIPAQEKKISSNFRKKKRHNENTESRYIDWEGILILDLLPIVKRDYKFDTYKLDNVAKNLVNAEKDPVNYKEIFIAYRSKEMARVGKYCVQDSNLCIDILNHINGWISLSEMSVVCKVSMFQLYTQGQQIRTYNQVYDYCLNRDIIVTSNGYNCLSGERYLGAYVKDPIPGIYENIVPLDFASLYPSIMINYNICYSTFVTDSEAKRLSSDDYHTFIWEDHVMCEHDPKIQNANKLTNEIVAIQNKIKKLTIERDESRGKEAKTVVQNKINKLRLSQRPFRIQLTEIKKSFSNDYDDENGNEISCIICAKRKYRFLKEHVKKGVIPTIIQNLLTSRKNVKNQMKTCSKEDAIVLDKKQLAYKVSANSQYGAMGVRRGYLPFMPGAMCITYLGRESIKKAANIVCEKYNAKWIYTDTDSTYIIFPHLTTPTEIWDEAIRVAGLVSNEFPGSISLEFEEAIYKKFIILSKKRYVYTSIDRNGTCNGNIGKKGVVLVRRDNACITRRIYENIVRMVFDNATKEMIIDYIIESINDLFRNIVPFTDFVITKSVGCTENDNDTDEFMGDYKIKPLPKDPNERLKALNGMTEKEYAISKCPPQVRLAELIKSRGRPVDDGSRLEFVIVDRNTKAVKVGDKMEDFEYFIKRSRYLSIDKLYYLDALINPIDQLLPIVIGSVDFMKCQYKIRENHYKMVKQLKKMFSPRVIMQS